MRTMVSSPRTATRWASDILDAYYSGGEAAALDVLGDAMAREYMGDAQYGWHFEPSAGRLDFLRHRSF